MQKCRVCKRQFDFDDNRGYHRELCGPICDGVEIGKRSVNADDEQKISNLAALVSRLILQVRKYDQKNKVAEQAIDYLNRSGMSGSILREDDYTVD